MAAAVDGGGDGKNPAAFRWIDAARYTVALVVAVLVVSVIVNAIKFVLRPDPLYFSVVGGFVSTAKLSPPPNRTLGLDLNVRAQNPGGRARIYYVNITAYFFDNSTLASSTQDPVFDSMAYFGEGIPDIAVPQQSRSDFLLHLTAKKGNMPLHFDSLYGGERMSNVTLRLDGNLTTEVYGSNNNTHRTTYYCGNLLLGGDKDDKAFRGLRDVTCNPNNPS